MNPDHAWVVGSENMPEDWDTVRYKLKDRRSHQHLNAANHVGAVVEEIVRAINEAGVDVYKRGDVKVQYSFV